MQDDSMIRFRLEKIIEHCNLIERDLVGLSFDDFSKSSLLCRATAFTINNICEQVTRLRAKFEDKYPEVKWQEITDLRILESHIYWKIDYKTIFEIATIDLPILKSHILVILEDLNKNYIN